MAPFSEASATADDPPPAGYDAFLLLSFGGPEGLEDVMPFLRNVTRGRGVPEERLATVAEHYEQLRGVSPINASNRELLAALSVEFNERGIDLPLYWGNRNWKPYVADAVRQMRYERIQRALVFTTSATASYSACRQYRGDLAQARAVAGAGAPELVKLRHFFDHPGFVTANADGVRGALDTLPPGERDEARLVFTAHSIPVAMNDTSGPQSNGLYAAQQHETARLVAEAVRGADAAFDLVWQSRSGASGVPWLEPDVNEHLRTLAASGVSAAVVSPTGFVADHVEVVWDLDTEARQTAAGLGLHYARAATAGTHPAFVAMITQLVEERLHGTEPLALGSLGVCGVDCPLGCCPTPSRAAVAS
ncbi:MAG: ferrochelatase [Jatrophihabitantaceae bacterium]